jgi:hypothetical protein
MSKPRFDPDRDYGTIHPFWNGAGYYQDGHYFSPQKDFLFSDGSIPSAASTPAGASVPAAKEAQNTHSATESAIKDNSEATTNEKTETLSQSQSGEIDMAAWGRGEVKAPFFAVKKAFTAQFPGVKITNAESIKAALKDAGVI